jgi:hypothetical protein
MPRLAAVLRMGLLLMLLSLSLLQIMRLVFYTAATAAQPLGMRITRLGLRSRFPPFSSVFLGFLVPLDTE